MLVSALYATFDPVGCLYITRRVHICSLAYTVVGTRTKSYAVRIYLNARTRAIRTNVNITLNDASVYVRTRAHTVAEKLQITSVDYCTTTVRSHHPSPFFLSPKLVALGMSGLCEKTAVELE